MEENKNIFISITIQDLLSIFIKRIWLIVVCAVLLAGIAYVYSEYYVVPLYRSDVMFLIDPIYNSDYDDYSDAQQLTLEYQSSAYARQLANTYLQILRTNSFRYRLIQEYEEKYGNRLNGAWSLSPVEDTELFMIRVTSTSSKDAFDIAQMIEKVAPEMIEELMGSQKIRVADNATESRVPINGGARRNVILGGMAGAVLAYGIGFLIFILDTRIKDEEDLKKRYDIPILGGIMDFDAAGITKKK
jgi:Capsular polysaccharide biosynthesis protein